MSLLEFEFTGYPSLLYVHGGNTIAIFSQGFLCTPMYGADDLTLLVPVVSEYSLCPCSSVMWSQLSWEFSEKSLTLPTERVTGILDSQSSRCLSLGIVIQAMIILSVLMWKSTAGLRLKAGAISA